MLIKHIQQKNQGHTKNNPQPTSTDQPGTESSPLFIKIVPPLFLGPSPAEHAQQSDGYTSAEWWLVWVTLILALITAILAGYTAKLWGATKALAQEAKQTATQQATDMQTSLAIAKTSADAALKTAKNMETADRAYMKMTHELPGIMFNEPKSMFQVTLRIENCGKTPASVSDVRLGETILEHGDPLPKFPLYSDPPFDKTHYGFLVPNDFFFHKRHFPTGPAMEEVRRSAKKLWIHAYVDYRDTFGQRYRAGYARTYEPVIDNGEQDNLLFVIEGHNNYDRQRQPGEGNDWNDPL